MRDCLRARLSGARMGIDDPHGGIPAPFGLQPLGFSRGLRYLNGMERILISACLVGRPVRYNGTDKRHDAAEIIARWQDEGRLVLVCPELAVGFPTPRPPAEIIGDGGKGQGEMVLNGSARVVEATGADVSELYIQAALDTVEVAKRHGCSHAVLTDGSPSCGSTFIYDGSFTGIRKSGVGTTTAALRHDGVRVWPETAISELDAFLKG